MTRTFISAFADRMTDFVAQKRALGFPYHYSEATLVQFDRLCAEKFQNVQSVTKELCLAWAVRRDKEGNNCFRNVSVK